MRACIDCLPWGFTFPSCRARQMEQRAPTRSQVGSAIVFARHWAVEYILNSLGNKFLRRF